MKKIKYLLAAAMLFSAVHSSFAQSKSGYNNQFLNEFVTRNWTASDGLPGNTITDLIQDSKGYLYIGTYEGLIRFDGIEFLTINKNYDPKYNFVSARSLYLDKAGSIWVGSNDEGLCCIKANEDVICYSTADGLPNNSIRSICQDFNGTLWVGTAGGIACISSDGKIYIPDGIEKLKDGSSTLVLQLYCDTAGRIWLVTGDSYQAYVYSGNTFELYKGIKGMKDPQITAVSQDSSGAFWFGVTPHHAVRIDGDEQQLFDIGIKDSSNNLVNCIFQDSRENIWFSMDRGVTIYHNGEFSYFSQENGLCDEKIYKITEDREGNIWLGTDRAGIEKLSQSKFKTTTMTTSINAIARDKFRDCVWLAGDDGLYCWQKNAFAENSITKLCRGSRVRHVSVTDKGELLISCYNGLGQLSVNLAGNVTAWTKDTGLAGNKVRLAERLTNGDLYIGTTTGLSIVDAVTGKITNITKDDGIASDYIMCIYKAPDNRIWCGTDGGGIFVLEDKKVIQSYSSADGLAGNVIFKINSIKEGEIWICTGTGINRYKDGSFFSFNTANGMGTDGIFQIINDYTNKVWCTSNKGIFTVKLEDLEAVADGKQNHVTTKFYGRADGLISSGMTSTSLSMEDDLGRLWFTLIDGFAIYDPVKSASNNKAPVIQIQEVTVDSEKSNFNSQTVVIPPYAKRLSIKYTGLSFVSSEQVRFKYKLEGFDNDYSDWTAARTVSYTNLKPGKYKFTVFAQNNDEIVSPVSNPVLIIKQPALYQNIWFWCVIILTVIFLAGFTIYERIARLKRYQTQLEKEVTEQTAELTKLKDNLEQTVKERTEQLEKEKANIEKLTGEIILALAGTVDAKDKYTKGHIERVAQYSKMIATRLGKTPEFKKNLYMVATLHDIGKIGIPDSIINKPGKLTADEYEIIKTHSTIGSKILSTITVLPEIGIGAHYHHERYDGKGYPEGLKGKEIPEIARIIGVADAYDAMTSNRSYRSYMPQDKVRAEIEKGIGTQFDPEFAKIMLDIIDTDTDYIFREQH